MRRVLHGAAAHYRRHDADGARHQLIVLFVALEWLSIGLYVLAGFAYPRIRSEEAAMKYLLYGAFAAGFLIYGIALIYGATGTTDLAAIGQALQTNAALQTSPVLLLGAGAALDRLRLQDFDGAVPYVDAGCVRGLAHSGSRLSCRRRPRPPASRR